MAAFEPCQALLDEQDDDYDPLEVEEGSFGRDGYWVSVDQIECQDVAHPEMSDWIDDSAFDSVSVTVDKARRYVWKQAKAEIAMLRRFWEGDCSPSFDSLASSLFGPNSKLFHLLAEELDLSYREFCQFMATLYSAATFGVSASTLYDVDRFDTSGFMEKSVFLSVLRRVEMMDASTAGDTFWMKAEEIFNSCFVMKKTVLQALVLVSPPTLPSMTMRTKRLSMPTRSCGSRPWSKHHFSSSK